MRNFTCATENILGYKRQGFGYYMQMPFTLQIFVFVQNWMKMGIPMVNYKVEKFLKNLIYFY